MILTKKNKILEIFSEAPWKKFTFKEIKSLTKNKSDNYLHSSLKWFVEETILKDERVGNIILYYLNNGLKALNLIGYIAEHKSLTMKHIPLKTLEKMIKKIKTPYTTIIVTGSYAKKTQKETSDLDVVIICDDEHSPKRILAEISNLSELSIPQIHPYVFTSSQFFEMLTNKEQNYGKEIAKHNLIFKGGRAYFEIVKSAVENGFSL